jgi:hypothetical protein
MYFKRDFLKTDAVGLMLIVTLQAFQGYRSNQEAKEKVKDNFEKSLN